MPRRTGRRRRRGGAAGRLLLALLLVVAAAAVSAAATAAASASPPRRRAAASASASSAFVVPPKTTSPPPSASDSAAVVVVGAGLAGLAVSLGLSREGYHVCLVEKSPDFDRRGATFGLARNGFRALAELIPEAAEILAEMGMPLPNNGGRMLPWWEVRDCLLELVRKDERIDLRTGLSLCDIDDETDPSTARVYFEDSDEVLEGALVVGADGVHSSVRDVLGLPKGEKQATVWRGSVHVDEDDAELSALLGRGITPMGMPAFGKTHFVPFNFHPKFPGRIAWVVSTKEEDIQPGTRPWDILEKDLEEGDEARSIIRAFFDKSDEKDLELSYDLRVHRLPEEPGSGWGGRGRVTLIGDAAHALRPADGQGGSMAFEDGVVLCRMLRVDGGVAICSDRGSCESFVTRFENERLPRVKRLWEDQEMRAEDGYKEKKGGARKAWSDEFREWVLNGV